MNYLARLAEARKPFARRLVSALALSAISVSAFAADTVGASGFSIDFDEGKTEIMLFLTAAVAVGYLIWSGKMAIFTSLQMLTKFVKKG